MLTYSNHQIDPARFAPGVADILLRKGLTHFLGNEQASKVTARAKAAEADNAPLSDEAKAALKDQFVTEAIEALYSGNLASQSRGPRVDPMTAEMQRIAKVEVLNILKAHKIYAGAKHPAAEDKFVIAGQELTFGQFVERRLAKHGDRIKKEAEKKLAEDARRAKKAQEEAERHVGKEGELSIDDIGL